MKTNGESIHGASACPFPKAPAWGRVTQKPGRLYLHVFDWPKDGKLAVCVPCIQERKIDVEDLIENAEPMAGGALTEEISSANATLVY